MERILVCLKRVVDYNVRVRVSPDGAGVVTQGLKMSINPFDEIALEEALRIRERSEAGEVVVVTIGTADCDRQLRTGLAMGADRAIRVDSAGELEPLAVAKTLLAVVRRERPALVLLGKQAIDLDQSQTGQMLAALWDRPQATFASQVAVQGEELTVTREVDSGLETLSLELPAVVTTDLRLNTPRYVKLPEIMKAKRKPLEVVALETLGVAPTRAFAITSTESPAPRPAGIRVDSVAALLDELRGRELL